MSICGLHGCFLPRKDPGGKYEPNGTTPETTDDIRSQLGTLAEEFEADGQRWEPTTADLKVCFARNLQLFESELCPKKQDLPTSLSQLCRDKAVDFDDTDTRTVAKDIELIMSRLCGILEKRYPYLKQHSRLIPIGSFHDRTKIQPVDEFDYIYVITPDAGDIVSKETRISQDLLQHVTRGSKLRHFLTDLQNDYPMDLRTMEYANVSAPVQAMRKVILPKGWKQLPGLDLLPDSFHKQGPACTFWFQRTVDSQDIVIAADFTMAVRLNWDNLGLEADGESYSSRNLDSLFPAVSDWSEEWKSRLVDLIKEKGVLHLCLLASGEYLSLSHIEVDVLNHHISPIGKDVLRLLKILTKFVFTADDEHRVLFVQAMNRKLQSSSAFSQAVFRITKQCMATSVISRRQDLPEGDIKTLVKAAREETDSLMSGVSPGLVREFLNAFIWLAVYRQLIYKVSNSTMRSRLFKSLLGHARVNHKLLRHVLCCSVGIEGNPHLTVCSAALKYTFLSLIIHRWNTEQWQWKQEDVPKVLVEVLDDFCERISGDLGVKHYITGHSVKVVRRRLRITLDQGVQLAIDVISGLKEMINKSMCDQ